jgi:AAA15 family ATPase/GTPase
VINRITTTYKNLNLDIKDLGEINYFVGKNGSGKTRLFELLEKYNSSLNPKNNIINFSEEFQTNISRVGNYTNIGFQPVNLNNLVGKKESNISGGSISEQEITTIILRLIFNENAVFNNSDWTISLNDDLKISLEETPSGFESIFKFWLSTFVNFPKIIGSKIFWFVCLDELDRHLHPNISKKVPELLNKLQSHLVYYCREKYNIDIQLQFFISTHSPFVIRGALEHTNHKIFHLEDGGLKKSFDRQKLIEQSGLPFDNVLSDLGFEMKDIYYPNCLIYVEGPVEVLFISYWLEKYFESKKLTKNHFVKGIDYDFVEFGGSLAAHLSLKFNSQSENEDVLDSTELVNIFSLNRKVFVMVDNDTGEKAFEKTKQRLKKEIQEKNNGSIFYRNSKYSTIESLLTKSTKRSKRKKDKLGAALVNLKYWRKNNIGLDKFNSETLILCESLFDFIGNSNS